MPQMTYRPNYFTVVYLDLPKVSQMTSRLIILLYIYTYIIAGYFTEVYLDLPKVPQITYYRPYICNNIWVVLLGSTWTSPKCH